MSKLELLCVTMHQTDFSKIEQMNLHCDVVFANQADWDSVEELEFENHRARMITTKTRGLSKNRNIAMDQILDDTEILLLTDDDLRFYDGFEMLVLQEFENHPDAEAIRFNLNSVSERKISMKQIANFHRATHREVGSWGVCGMAIKTKALYRYGLRFNERFGAGTPNYCGEDTIFLQEMLKKRIRLYASPICIADIDQSVSSWFEGYTARYFTTNGMILHEIYPGLCYLLALRSAWRFSRRPATNLGLWDIIKCYYRGISKNREEKRSFRRC